MPQAEKMPKKEQAQEDLGSQGGRVSPWGPRPVLVWGPDEVTSTGIIPCWGLKNQMGTRGPLVPPHLLGVQGTGQPGNTPEVQWAPWGPGGHLTKASFRGKGRV